LTHDRAEQTIGQALDQAVARFGDKEAFTYVDRRLSFRDVDRESDAVARALLGSGIKHGDYVAVWMANHSPWAALYFGILKIGAVLVPLNTRSRPDELVFGLQKSGAKMVIFKREQKGRTDYGDMLVDTIPELRNARPGELHAHGLPLLRAVVDVADVPMNGTLSFAEFLERGNAVSAADLAAAKQAVGSRDEAVIVYTSGTTSVPKGAQLYHEGMLHSVRWSDSCIALTERDVYFSLQPVYHSGGAIGAMLRPIVDGCRLVTQPYFDPAEALAAIEAESVTVMSGLQPHWVEYLNHPSLAQRKLKVERAFVMAPPELLWTIYEKMGIEGLVTGYCMTETHLYGTNTTLADSREVRYNTNGRPNPDVELEIRDPDDGTLLGVEESGEIFMRVPHPMSGYLGEPQLTADVLGADGWYRTGDNGVIREDGNLILLGRVRDMIRVGGENLSGAEVEAVLVAHPAVKQAAAVPAPDARLGEIVVSFVEIKPGMSVTEAELIEHCRAKLANFKVPRAVHFVTEWPMTGSGKVQKRSLLETVA
jgi:acyl-CoA synthetase (AMP-forming)/AMP-acid ligase II